MPASSIGTTSKQRSDFPPREADVLRRGLSLLEARLPPGWGAQIDEQARIGGSVLDALVGLTAPDGSEASLAVESKQLVAARDAPALLEQIESVIAREAMESVVPMVVARYLPASTREWLVERGVSYADTTGNLRVVLDRPALFVRDVGADRDPWRRAGRPRDTLKGPPAARVVRALVDFLPPMTVSELARRSGASTGATYRVIELLDREGLIRRQPRGPIEAVEWRRLLERWSGDYSFQESNRVGAYLAPRGLPSLLEALKSAGDLPYALTGSLAAERLAPYAPPRLAMVYVDDIENAAERLDLRAVDAGANVLLAAGEYEVVFERTLDLDGLKLAAPSQVAADLLTGPGRSPAEAQALLDWMEVNEDEWRR